MIISPQLFESYLLCPTKCWLRSRGEPPARNPYSDWVNARNKTYLQDGLRHLLANFRGSDCVTAPSITEKVKGVTWRIAIDVHWKTKEAELIFTSG